MDQVKKFYMTAMSMPQACHLWLPFFGRFILSGPMVKLLPIDI